MATNSDMNVSTGFQVSQDGTRLPMRVKSSRLILTLGHGNRQHKCKTALVDPPSESQP